MRISSTDNPIYRRLKQLATSAKACREARRTLIEGVHLLQAALDARVSIQTLVLRGAEQSKEAVELARAAEAQSRAKLIELAPSLYDAISPIEHGAGVLAEIQFTTQPWPKQILDDAIYLDNVQDPGNVGALLRTAAAASVRHAIAGLGCAHIWSPKVMRAAMGAHFVLDLHEQITPQTLRDAFKGEALAADANDGEDLFEAEWGSPPTLWMFGGEGPGLSSEALVIAHRSLRIPIDERVESLNVAAAAAVCLFEQKRRRTGPGSTVPAPPLDRITQQPEVMGGKACIRGMRVTVGMVVGQIGAGHSVDQVLADYPYLERADIMQALRYAAWRAEGREIMLARG